MKTLIKTVLLCLMGSTMCYGQVVPQPPQKMTDVELGHYYLDKSKKQKTWGFVLAGVGLGCIFGASAMIANDDWYDEGNEAGYTALSLIGTGAIIGTIPLFTSAAKNKGRAEILLRYENVPLGYLPQSPGKYPAVGVKIPIGKK
jgi:hypothetical protein